MMHTGVLGGRVVRVRVRVNQQQQSMMRTGILKEGPPR